MSLIRSMEDLEQAKANALEQQRLRNQQQRAQIRVAMGSCGIAVGARDTFDAFKQLIARDNLLGIGVTQTGCIGLCALEPIVQVQVGEQTRVTYGKVTPEVARRILQQHIINGIVVQEYVIENV